MNILISCSECKRILTDKFGCERCFIHPNGKSALEMECTNCDKYYLVVLNLKTKEMEMP